jgi:hypothetical protein
MDSQINIHLKQMPPCYRTSLPAEDELLDRDEMLAECGW